jgi:hypothetical protein
VSRGTLELRRARRCSWALKSDPCIAHNRPGVGRFVPGHDKWDLQHSIGVLKPDIIVTLPTESTEQERGYVRSLGYHSAKGGWLIR